MRQLGFTASADLLVNTDVTVRQSKTFEVSIDCIGCRRTGRTVEITLGAGAICRKTDHPVDAILHSVDVSDCTAEEYFDLGNDARCVAFSYRFSYAFEDFEEDDTGYPAMPEPHHGRIRAWLACPKCAAETIAAIQPNITRPHRIVCGTCGHLLAIDPRQQPEFTPIV